jgi:catechol 2,3-dioxygenase-like lactoylglutathione lyase family enzyme
MYDKVLNKYAVNQIAYYVEDLEQACLAHSALFGSGPFKYMDPITMTDVDVRGEKVDLTMQTACGQHGGLQIEMIQVLSDGPSPYKEMGRFGFHHFCIWVDDFDGALADFAAAGCDVAMQFVSGGGMRVAYVDCREAWGYYVEIHQPIEQYWGMYKAMADNWDGSEPYSKFQMPGR